MMRGDAEKAKSNFLKSISGMIHLGEKTLAFKETNHSPEGAERTLEDARFSNAGCFPKGT